MGLGRGDVRPQVPEQGFSWLLSSWSFHMGRATIKPQTARGEGDITVHYGKWGPGRRIGSLELHRQCQTKTQACQLPDAVLFFFPLQ